MPFERDTLTQSRAKILADLSARLPGADPYIRRAVLNVLGTVLAGLHQLEFGYLDWQAQQAVPFTATAEYLEAWAGLRGVARKSPAPANGTVTFAGAVAGTEIAIGTELRRGDGETYQVTTGATVAGDGTATVTVSDETAGAQGDCPAGTVLSLVLPVAGLPDSGVVVTITGGADLETDDQLRSRMIAAFSAPPQGGDLADYVAWARGVAGVTRAWAAGPAVMGAGTVTVYVMLDDASHDNGLPSGSNGVSQYESRGIAATGDQLMVADAIYPQRPVTALVYVAAPVGDPLAVTLAEVPDDATIRGGITAALAGFLLREASPGGVMLDDLSAGGTIRVSHLEDAIAAVPGLDHFVLMSPTADITAATGHIAVPGTITYT